jgi:hypothetical protein
MIRDDDSVCILRFCRIGGDALVSKALEVAGRLHTVTEGHSGVMHDGIKERDGEDVRAVVVVGHAAYRAYPAGV